MTAPAVTKRAPHPNALRASNEKEKFRMRAANNPTYRELNEPLNLCAVRKFANSMTIRIDPITIELTIHVAPKRRLNAVTPLVSIKRKLAPMKNKCQLTCQLTLPTFKRQ